MKRNFEHGRNLRELVLQSIEGKTGDPPWQWCSFADEGFLGVAIIRAWNVGHAAMIAHELGINPGGECMAAPVPEQFGPPPAELDHKLVTDRDELDRLTQAWHGCGVLRVNSRLEPQDS